MLVYDLTKVIDCGLIIGKAPGRIANIVNRAASAIRNAIPSHVANCIERQIDVARTQSTSRTNLCWVGLVEYVEKPGSELEFLRLADIEVLEE